ncbi:hypothetical protein NDA13_001041 [Ustilago tritici]|nr:hypothetical protein NDA13_001041 [Ustilago tritici]
MVAGSRKRRRPDGRLASPPLAPSPLLTRNLQLLPVGLTQLPNDALFVSRLRKDVDDLLSAFAEAFLLSIITHGMQTGHEGATSFLGPTFSSAYEGQHVASPFSVFTQVWQQKGWHYAQFTFADHADSKRAVGNAICRVLLEHLTPYVAEHNDSNNDEAPLSISFTDLKQLFKILAVPFALYMFWVTQIYPTSGIGVKHCRPALERIAIEQDYYDWLLELPEAVLKHLREEQRTRSQAEAITADLAELLCRLAGEPFDEQSLRQATEKTQKPAPKPCKNASSNPRRSTKPPERLEQNIASAVAYPDGIFDIIPSSKLGTRLPRTWPSVRVMSTLEANKEFGRVGNIVRFRQRENEGDNTASSSRAGEGAGEVKEKVAGLSRGDVVRLKARQRLAVASADLSKLLPRTARNSASTSEQGASGSKRSELIAQTAQHTAPATSSSPRRGRYEIETPAWISNAKYTAKLKPWLEESPTPMQQSIQRSADSKRRYQAARENAMPSEGVGTDFGEWVLQKFREERKKRADQQEIGEQQREDEEQAELARVEHEGSLSLEELYRLAAERTKTAAVQQGELLKSMKGRSSGSR